MIELSTYNLDLLRNDKEISLYRGRSEHDGPQILVVSPAAEYPAPETLKRLEHEYSLREELEPAWAVRPIAITQHWNRSVLVLEDPGGIPLDQLLGQPLEIAFSLRLAVNASRAIAHLHRRDIIHKDIKPANVLVNPATGQCWLTGFGIASRVPRERRAPEAPEFLEGTLAYMAPEQTGRMNRSVDSRSDLYSLGVALYQTLSGSLPFTASDPMEWIHCHIARKPAPLSERLESVPAPISAIIMKLLAKTAEERYQTAAGVESDLQRCLDEWQEELRPPDLFSLGERDIPDRLLIPEKLYGRASEIETLLTSFDRVVADGGPELVLVSGYSGIGKSSVVNELHKVLIPPRGLFASGKFDQYKRDIPYATLAQAFQSLIRPLLGEREAELRDWRDALQEALGANGPLIADLVPELKLIIGEQPPVPELPPQDAQRRFQMVFRRFISVFARPEHPLALFLDDLQWLDTATLDLLDDLLTHPDLQHLMLIGAYRDNEVNSAHPLMRKLEAIRQAGARVQEIILAPLTCKDLGRLIADSLHCEPGDGPASSRPSERVNALARLIHEKTAGNPFFVIQFISALAEEALFAFDHGSGRWSWDLSRIQAKGYTDNVVDLMIGKLNRLPVETQKALQEFACLGNSAEITTLSVVHGLVLRSQDGEGGLVLGPVRHSLGDGGSPSQPDEGGSTVEDVHPDLWEALRLEFIVRLEDSYRFVHDRVQEAAYSLIPEQLRAEAHLRIGRLLWARTPPERREAAIFEIVNQLNRGAALITSQKERYQVAELNLIAGKRAKASTAYASALKYLIAGAGLLGDDCWERQHELVFALELHRAECEFVIGEPAAVEERLTVLWSRAANTVELASVACLRVELYTTLNQSDRGVAVCFDYLQHLGVEWSPHPSEEEARREYERIWKRLGSRSIEELIDLPLMSDPATLATLDVLIKALPSAWLTDANLRCLVICRAVNLSLERGNTDGSCVAYVNLGMIAGPNFGNYQAGFRFGQLGYELVEKRGLQRFQARTYTIFGTQIIPWVKHIQTGLDLIRRGFEAANNVGDVIFAAFSCAFLNTNRLAAGDPLAEVQRETENGVEFAQKARFGLMIDTMTPQLGLVWTLRGLTPKFGSLNHEGFDELLFERHLASEPALAMAECFYWIRKLQARFIAGDYVSAFDASLKAQQLLWTSPSSFFETAEYHFYGALARAAVCDVPQFGQGALLHHSSTPSLRVAGSDDEDSLPDEALSSLAGSSVGERSREDEALSADFEALVEHQKQLTLWAENCPENFENRAALVGAEIARVEGRELDAERLYEQAIRSAQANGFVYNEALSNELAARFYRARGFDTIAHAYLRKARYCYLRWGADGKARQLEKLYPRLGEEDPGPGPTSTIGAPVEHLDLATVIKVSQAVSGEIVFGKLIDTLMRTAIEHAGAERGLLILPRGVEQRIEAEAVISGDSIMVNLREASMADVSLPESIVHHVVRTHENVILEDASAQNPFSTDSYIRQHHARSILCLPLISQAKLIAALYLENNLGPHVFTPTRIAVLKLLASQAAISLERKRAEEAAQKAQDELAHVARVTALGELATSIAHEVNQPLGAIVNYGNAGLRFLKAGSPDLTQIGTVLSAMVADANRASAIIARIRALSKKSPPELAPLQIKDLITDTQALVRHPLTENRIVLKTTLAGDLSLVLGDRIQLQQVLLNLVVNSIDAMKKVPDDRRELSIEARSHVFEDKPFVLVAVTDSGVGLKPEDLPRLFEPFYTTKAEGLGMGLAISRSIMEAQGGRLWATLNTDVGATFQFMLPAQSQ